MSNAFEDLPVRPKRDTFLLVSSVVLVLFTAGFLWVAFTRYQNRIQSISLTENRFVKTEWHLLQDLKAQTDQELLQKDQEIADLNRRYLNLVRHSGAASEIQRVESLLHQAQAQREAILNRSAQVSGADTATKTTDQSAWLATLAPTANQSIVSKLLRERIATLDAQLKETRQQNEVLAKELAASEARYDGAVQGIEDTMRLQKQQAGTVSAPTIQGLDTWALVRAIISSPEVRAKYPGLLRSLDSYMKEYGIQERVKGRQEAMSAIEAALNQVVHAAGSS